MASVLGVGGIFFKSRDPKALGEWYRRWLGLEFDGQLATLKPATMPAAGATVWSPFPAATNYVDPSSRDSWSTSSSTISKGRSARYATAAPGSSAESRTTTTDGSDGFSIPTATKSSSGNRRDRYFPP